MEIAFGMLGMRFMPLKSASINSVASEIAYFVAKSETIQKLLKAYQSETNVFEIRDDCLRNIDIYHLFKPVIVARL